MRTHSRAITYNSAREQRLLQFLCHTAERAVCLMLILVLALLTTGCSRRYDDMPVYLPFGLDDYENQSVGRFKSSYLAEQIDNYYRGTNPGPIGVTTFVNIDDLYNTSTFGRMYGEQLMGELAMRGYDVVELRHSDALQFLNGSGEFSLSRDLGNVRRSHNLGGIVVGTYVVSPVRVYVNARLIDPSSALVLSAASAEMSKTTELARLIRGGSAPGTLERIPVKHLGLSTYPLALFPTGGNRVRQLEEDSWAPPAYIPAPSLPAPAAPKWKAEKPEKAVAEPKSEESELPPTSALGDDNGPRIEIVSPQYKRY